MSGNPGFYEADVLSLVVVMAASIACLCLAAFALTMLLLILFAIINKKSFVSPARILNIIASVSGIALILSALMPCVVASCSAMFAIFLSASIAKVVCATVSAVLSRGVLATAGKSCVCVLLLIAIALLCTKAVTFNMVVEAEGSNISLHEGRLRVRAPLGVFIFAAFAISVRSNTDIKMYADFSGTEAMGVILYILTAIAAATALIAFLRMSGVIDSDKSMSSCFTFALVAAVLLFGIIITAGAGSAAAGKFKVTESIPGIDKMFGTLSFYVMPQMYFAAFMCLISSGILMLLQAAKRKKHNE